MTSPRLVPLVILAALALALAPAAASAAPRPVDLDLLGRTAALGEGGAEIAAFDPRTERVFATNAAANTLDVYDLSDPAAPVRIDSIDLSPYGAGPNSVDVSTRRGGLVAVAVEADPKTAPGSVQFFSTDGDRLGGVPAGALPDMVTFTHDGRTLLVANEGEPEDDVDPEGSVTVIDLKRGVGRAQARTATLDGVPALGPIRRYDNTFAQDLEPEYIAVGPNDRFAWVTIQEANAIGILDVEAAKFRLVRGLGFKDHGLARNALDPSDRDGGIRIAPWPNVVGMYQPDAIAAYTTRDGFHLVTANEGDSREEEESRVEDLALDPAVFPPGTQDDARLGRLTVTTREGDANGDGLYERLFAFGGRSLSILNPLGGVVYDTGDGLERTVAAVDPTNWNKDNEAGSPIDNRSDNKGPEPEGVDVGEIRGRPYAFAGAERQGGLFAYDLGDDPGRASLAGYVNTREDDLGPEGIRFVPGDDGPTGKPLVLVTNEITGTIGVFGVSPG